MSAQRFTMPIYVAVFLQKDNQILLIKRSKSIICGGLYAMPGGGVDGLETLADAAIREAHEELGIIIDKKNLQFMHVQHVKRENNAEFIAFFFHTTQWTHEPAIMEPDKCDEVNWFSIDQLPQPMETSHQLALELMQQHIDFSQLGW